MMRTCMAMLLPALVVIVAGCEDPLEAGNDDPLSPDDGLVVLNSDFSVDETFNRLEASIEEAEPLSVIATLDHAENAQSVGMDLPPTRIILFGNPNLGTPLMQSSRTVGIDLPQKFLVWQDDEGQVRVAYNDPDYLARRHGIDDRADELDRISDALLELAEGATRP